MVEGEPYRGDASTQAKEFISTAARIGREVRRPTPTASTLRRASRRNRSRRSARPPARRARPGRGRRAGLSVTRSPAAVTELGQHCASTAMVFAMHQIQVACLVRHGRTPALRDFARRGRRPSSCCSASATTEIGIGGDIRTQLLRGRASTASSFTLDKHAPVISYGQYADAILATARRARRQPAQRPGPRASAEPAGSRLEPAERLGHARLPRHLQPRASSSTAQRRRRRRSSTTRTATSPARRCCRSRTCCGPRCGSASPTAAVDRRAQRFVQTAGPQDARRRRRPARPGWPSSTVTRQQFADARRRR